MNAIMGVPATLREKCYWIKSMYIMGSNQYAMELVTYLLVLVVYFYELIVYMLLERNALDSIAFFSQCTRAAVEELPHSAQYVSSQG